jgi:hypothetical protein
MINFCTLFQECSHHLSVGSEAKTHFRAVCRALVSEALELSVFLEKVSHCDSERSEELMELDMQDWVSECEREKRTSFKNKKNSDDIF